MRLRLGARPSGQERRASCSKPPAANASATAERERATASLPEGEQLLGGVFSGGAPLPVGVSVPVHCVPRRRQRPPEQPTREVVVLHQRQVLEQPTERDRSGGEPRPACLLRRAHRISRRGLPAGVQGSRGGWRSRHPRQVVPGGSARPHRPCAVSLAAEPAAGRYRALTSETPTSAGDSHQR